ncbi:MAG TPA: folylpolyglutamate synthase/dihydrofolate synthase family protein [Sphingomicrobium sp.]|nr:folylpolyglutamate synthase/dihydrofolate synthase family protein [Sphingomicrobium sp.]
MADFARSKDTAVQLQLDRLATSSTAGDRLGLDRISRLLDRLGRPQDALPPVFHVAGTNGKGSTCAFLRAAIEAAGLSVHVFTSPHLVRFNERIRLAGELIDDESLADLLEEVIDAGKGIDASFFEVITAVAFLAFARTPADACIIEVGLGGRLDATNVVERPVVCGIASLGLDHQQFLGSDLVGIAREKAAIAKPGVPLVTLDYPEEVMEAVQGVAEKAGTDPCPALRRWHYGVARGRLQYRDGDGALMVPLPTMQGLHQLDNCALALAMLRHQRAIHVPLHALKQMPLVARWPGRLQQLGPGPLVAAAGGAAIWVDGGHNPDAAERIADWLEERPAPPALVIGLLANKDAQGFVAPLAALASEIRFVPVPGHDSHAADWLARLATAEGARKVSSASSLEDAVRRLDAPEVAILGSLYLAGEALAANDEAPD